LPGLVTVVAKRDFIREAPDQTGMMKSQSRAGTGDNIGKSVDKKAQEIGIALDDYGVAGFLDGILEKFKPKKIPLLK